MDVTFNKIDSAPIFGQEFSAEFMQWLSILVDTLNEALDLIQYYLNLLQARSYESSEIAALFSDGKLQNGMILYDTDLNVYVGMQNGGLVQFSTTSYP